MRKLALVLKICAPVFLLVAALHLALGLQADALLGAAVDAKVAAEPSLDSQNRFYGMAFALYGVVLAICATDLRRFEPVFTATMWVFFAAGVARIVSWTSHGAPAPAIIFLAATELTLPLLLLAWHARIKRSE